MSKHIMFKIITTTINDVKYIKIIYLITFYTFFRKIEKF
jgi:hypothetical protein